MKRLNVAGQFYNAVTLSLTSK